MGVFIHLLIVNNIQSFGVSYLDPYMPSKGKVDNGIFTKPIWKREKRDDFIDPKRPNKEGHISMKWKYPDN